MAFEDIKIDDVIDLSDPKNAETAMSRLYCFRRSSC